MERNRFVYMRFNRVGRSTSEEEGSIMFPRKDDNAPRNMIYRIECPSQLTTFESCMSRTGGDLTACAEPKQLLEECGNAAFKSINGQPDAYDYSKGHKRS